MLTIHLNPPGGSPGKQFLSAWFVMQGAVLNDSEGRELALLQAGVWHSPPGVYLFADVQQRVRLTIENEEFAVSEELGIFEGISIINGGIWTIEKRPQLLAEFDYALLRWHIRVRPAPIISKVIIQVPD
jgi:hypothetical protein